MRGREAQVPPPTDITIPGAGSHTARDILSQSIRRLLADVRALPATVAPNAAAREDLGTFTGVLSQLLRSPAGPGPGALFTVLRRPNVGGLVRCLRTAAAPDGDPVQCERLFTELVATTFLELAWIGSLPQTVRLQRLPAQVVMLGARLRWRPQNGLRNVSISNAGVDVDDPSEARRISFDALRSQDRVLPVGVDRAFHALVGNAVLALADNNPLAMLEAHPDKFGNAIDLGDRPVTEWQTSLNDCLTRIEQYLPDVRREIDLYVQQFVPVGFDTEKHLSASYQEAIGTIYLTLHPHPMTMTEAVIHEFSHNKINALFELDDLLINAFQPLYKSPVRPDPRPLHGVLLAVHAFLPVALLYERMKAADDPLSRHAEFDRRFDAIRALNHEGATTVLTHAQPTPVGRSVLDEIARWDSYFARR